MAIWVRTPEELSGFLAALGGGRSIALDSESDSLYHHFEKVCLLQLAGEGGQAALIDTLALKDLSPLAPLLADPGVVKVLHGADYDVTTLKRDFGFRFAGLFDTMIAARFLSLPAVGLQAVAGSELGVTLSKGFQKDDWSRRPLTREQEDYALADVRHLIALHDRLADRLREKGRLEWVREECDVVAALEPARRRADPLAYQSIKGARRLSPRGLAVLRELHAWREGQAAATDRPAFKIAPNEALLALAESPPRTRDELARVRGSSLRLRAQAREVLDAVARALATPEAELPHLAPVARPEVPAPVRRRMVALRAWRASEAERLALDASVVLPQRLLERVAEAAPRDEQGLADVEGLRRWRRAQFGQALLAAVASA